jgi:hypothetical protein
MTSPVAAAQADQAARSAALVGNISSAIVSALGPSLESLAKQSEENKTLLQGIIAKLALIDSVISSGAPKRPARAPASNGATKGDKKGATTDESKITNSLLFFRFKMKTEPEFYEDMSKTHAELFGKALLDSAVIKKGKDSADQVAYRSAVAQALWKLLPEETRKRIKDQFAAWKQTKQMSVPDSQLGDEGTDSAMG